MAAGSPKTVWYALLTWRMENEQRMEAAALRSRPFTCRVSCHRLSEGIALRSWHGCVNFTSFVFQRLSIKDYTWLYESRILQSYIANLFISTYPSLERLPSPYLKMRITYHFAPEPLPSISYVKMVKYNLTNTTG